jgi:hypothetical protein
MSWGNKLVVVFIVFALLIGTLVYKAMHTKYELVTKDYYGEELRYQDKIDGKQNASTVSAVSVTQDTNGIIIQFPKEQQSAAKKGEAWFYYASDESKDVKIPLQTDVDGKQIILKDKLHKGACLLKLTWSIGKENFYDEENLNIK